MKRFIWFMIPFLVLGVVLAVYAEEGLYGNDEESIIRVINSIEGYENMSIEILEIKDFINERVVPILADGSPGYIEFDQDKDGNYKWRHLEVRNQETFSTFIPNVMEEMTPFLIVTNGENDIAKMTVDINGQPTEVEFQPMKASVKWIELPNLKNSFTDYRYYDNSGNLIE
ncbi:hypothetical protein [Ornithinibacillus californiensis]|uniref:hypothetical protein n=1 Tax=Ornithinibacillus californiensis TaxID=161536 RepID=UPI00064DCB35|nr:hypothetical protein [Ornithinibacillus californiensis]